MIGKAVALIGRALSGLLILLVRGYQLLLRPILPKVCRFTPSCSEYFIQAVRKHGPLRGAWKGHSPHRPLPSLEPRRLGPRPEPLAAPRFVPHN